MRAAHSAAKLLEFTSCVAYKRGLMSTASCAPDIKGAEACLFHRAMQLVLAAQAARVCKVGFSRCYPVADVMEDANEVGLAWGTPHCARPEP